MAEIASEGMMYLHGDLELKIVKARNLPNMDLVSKHLRLCFTGCEACRPHRSAAKDGADDKRIKHHRKIITSDPYVKVSVPHATLARTRVIPNTQNPIWNQRFYIPLAHPAPNLEFTVKDNDVFGAQLIGKVLIPAEKIPTGDFISGWFPVIGAYGKPPKPDTALYLEMKFTPFDKNPLYQHGIAADPEHKGVRNTYFPLRRGSSVELYQDAHIRNDDKLPEIEVDGGKVFEQGKCWEDMCHAISEAHHLIYIIGWSIYHNVRLIREPTRPLPGGGDLTLGELLKYKSEEGVRVLLLIWDDKTSHKKMFINTEKSKADGSENVSYMLYSVFSPLSFEF